MRKIPKSLTGNVRNAPGGRGGGSLIFSYIRRLRSFFLIQNFDFQYFSGFSDKRIFFFLHVDFVDIVVFVCLFFFVFFFLGGGGGHHKIGLYLGAVSMHFRVFS